MMHSCVHLFQTQILCTAMTLIGAIRYSTSMHSLTPPFQTLAKHSGSEVIW